MPYSSSEKGSVQTQLNQAAHWFPRWLIGQAGHSPVSFLYCASVNGTTESHPWRTSGDIANSGSDLICASVPGFASAFPALISTAGFFGFDPSTDSTEAV